MGALLRSLHNQFGEGPQVSKLFQVRGTQTGWTDHLIVTKASTDEAEAAMISDDAAHLGTSSRGQCPAMPTACDGTRTRTRW